jgi:hypothetical protein
MKLSELFLTQEDQVKQAETKLKGLKRSIEDGDAPEIHNASGSIQGPAWGDLEKLGYAEKETEPQGGMEMADRWVLLPSAPGPVTLLVKTAKSTPGGMQRSINKKVMQPGQKTDWAYYSVD